MYRFLISYKCKSRVHSTRVCRLICNNAFRVHNNTSDIRMTVYGLWIVHYYCTHAKLESISPLLWSKVPSSWFSIRFFWATTIIESLLWESISTMQSAHNLTRHKMQLHLQQLSSSTISIYCCLHKLHSLNYFVCDAHIRTELALQMKWCCVLCEG